MLMSVGWDFTFWDGVRDRNTGIWRSISLYSTGNMTVRHPFVKAALADEYGPSQSIKEYGWKTQLLGAMNAKSIWDVWNYNKLEYGDRFCTGTLFWSHASPIPMVKNHMWDWYLIPTAALYHTMHALEPVHVQYDYLKNTVSVYNDRPSPLSGLSVTARLYNLDSKLIATWSEQGVSVPADGVLCDVLQLSIPRKITPVHFITLEIAHADAPANPVIHVEGWNAAEKLLHPGDN